MVVHGYDGTLTINYYENYLSFKVYCGGGSETETYGGDFENLEAIKNFVQQNIY